MDYTVVIERLEGHGREVADAAGAAGATLGSVRLDAADAAMPGSMSAAASRALQDRFQAAGTALAGALGKYAEAAHSAAGDYRAQEEQAAAAISAFFGQA